MRVKRGFKARRRRNRVLKLAKGFRGRRHNLSLGKNRKRKNRLGKSLVLVRRDEKHLKRALPYGLPK